MIIPVILSGGAGTRLWPVSRRLSPKQLAPLAGSHSLLQQTASRLEGITAIETLIVVSNRDHAAVVHEQLAASDTPPADLVLEPVGRNTAPAAATAALVALRAGGDPLLLVTPADHVIDDVEAFHAAVMSGTSFAEQGRLVTFGIVPDRPETGYGYIERGRPFPGAAAFGVTRFVEKPDALTAAAYLSAGNYFWNSGMFLFRASVYLSELGRLRPDMVASTRAALEGATPENGGILLDPDEFAACPADSIDYAVMEHVPDGVVVPLEAGWSDVGSWRALWDIGPADQAGNVVQGDVIVVDTKRSYLRAESRLVAVVGLHDIVVVETPDAVLVAPLDRTQDVKRIVDRLVEADRPEAEGPSA